MHSTIDEIINTCIADEVSRQLPVHVAEHVRTIQMPSDFVDITELANYWRMKGTAGIREWMKLSDDPLPYCLMGSEPRFHIHTVNEWATRRGKNQQTRRIQKQGEEDGIRLVASRG